MKKENIIWGSIFILMAVFVIGSGLGYFGNVSLFMVIFTVLFAALLVKSLCHLEYAGILFSIAFLCILYDEQLHIEDITPFPVLLAALLGSIGLSMIFPSRRYHRTQVTAAGSRTETHHGQGENFDKIIDEPDTSVVDCDISFGSAVKYVNSDCFESASVKCSFGAAKVYFDNVTFKGDSAVVNVGVNFAGVELYIPGSWRVENKINCSLGAVEEKGRTCHTENAPLLRLQGNVSFSGVTIHYI